MQHSIVNYSDIDLNNRIDAEYFQPTYLEIEEKLESINSEPLRKYCKDITGSAFYPATTHLYATGDIPFIRCVDTISFPTITSRQDASFEKIPASFANEYKNIKRLTKEDIVITKVGTPCFSSIIHDIDDVALSRTVLGLRKIQEIDPYYLTVFLRSKYGFFQLYRERELTIQYQLTLERVGNILIYKPKNEKLEKIIAELLMKYEDNIGQSIQIFSSAQELLLSELGLSHWQPPHQLNYIRNYSETTNAERIDAEYYQPKYDHLIKTIKNYSGGWDILDNLVKIKKCVEIGSNEYTEQGIPFIRVSNLSPFELSEEKYLSEELYSKLISHQPQKGEILLSKDASPGIAYYIKEKPRKMIPSGGILRLKPNHDNNLNEETLTLILNSLLVKEQLNRDVGGSIIIHWRPDQVKNTIIPIISEKVQSKIQEKVVESSELRDKSSMLLDCGKRAIEKAIENSEEDALEWIEKELREIDARL